MTRSPSLANNAPGRRAAPAWPARGALCLDCRTALAPGQGCPVSPRHRVASLADPAGRDALLTRVWGPRPVREHIRDATRAGAVSGTGSSVLDSCGLIDCLGGGVDLAELGAIALLAAVIAAVVFVLWLVITLVPRAIRAWRRSRWQPRGVRRAPDGLGRPSGLFGTITAVEPARGEPLTGHPCLAFAVELVHRAGWRRRRRMLRDAVTVGFEVALDDGGRVRIPPGSLLLDLDAARTIRPPVQRMADYLAEIDPGRAASDDLDTVPHHEVRHLILRAGQRVEVRGRLHATADPRAVPSGYRDAAATLLVPDGAPRLVLAPARE
jgi:hypothetical protein